MEVTNMLIIGPIKIADMPVPAGWEQVPAVGTGTGIQEMTKISAPIIPKSGLKPGVNFDLVLMSKIPFIRKGAATRYQTKAQLKGRMPSEMCMAYTFLAKKNKYRNTTK